MRRILLFSALLLSFIQVFGYFDLKVGDPRESWWTQQGTIEEASISVNPQGLYTEYNLYLTFSSRGTNWTSVEDTVEVTLNFDLPQNAIVHDSWLWIEGEPVRAKIMDKWTASSIYESIVKRRRDPSILRKIHQNHYELRIFPMAGNETRKVKITVLIPSEWKKNYVATPIPTTLIFGTSKYKPSSVNLYTWNNEEWKNPRIFNHEYLEFEEHTDTEFSGYKKTVIPYSILSETWTTDPLMISFDNPMKNGLYLSKYQEGSDGVYQLAIFPSDFIESVPAKKLAILVDFDASNTDLSREDLLNLIKEVMLQNLTARDSFNLIFSGLNITRYKEKWVSADSLNIEAAFNDWEIPLSKYSNLAPLIGNGVNFIKENANDGKIILISNSDQYGDYQVSNTLIEDINKMMDTSIEIHISDYQSKNYKSYYFNGRNFIGNEYLYFNLSKMNSGSYQRVYMGNSQHEIIESSFKYVYGAIKSFDLYTSMNNGYCHSRYLIKGNENLTYVNDPILQVGKFKGDFPVKIEVSGEYNNQVFSENFSVSSEEVYEDDSITQVIWTGQFIRELESDQQNNDVINEIIYRSVSERVLSRYTAFLCLEKDFQIDEDYDDEFIDENDDIFIKREEISEQKDSIKVYPNPFAENVNIEIQVPDTEELKELAIYNISGKLIYRFNISMLNPGINHIFRWDGTSSTGETVKSGIYLLIYRTSGETKTIRLMKM